MFKTLLRRRRAPSVATLDALKEYLDSRAALVAQKSIIGYCLVKTSLPLHELTVEQQFAGAFERARWEAFAAILADLIVVTEAYLRPAAPGREALLPVVLAQMFRVILSRHSAPSDQPDGGKELAEALRQRLTRAQLAPPATIAAIAQEGAERLYATLPIHETLRAPDKPAILANVQFLMVGLAHEFESQFDAGALSAELLASDPVP